MALALGPAIMVLAGPRLRRRGTVMRVEITVSAAICVLLGMLTWSSFSGRSGLGSVSAGHTAVGVVFTLICAAGSAVNIIYMKRLDDAGCYPSTVLATRFILMSVVSWVLVALEGGNDIFVALLPGAIVAVGGVGLPIYLLQFGVRYTEPITTSLLISLSPLFAFVMELSDRRLRFSPFTLGGILGVVALVAIGVVSRDRRSASQVPDPAAPTAMRAIDKTVMHDELVSDERGVSRIMKAAIVDAYGAGRLLPHALKLRGVEFVHMRSPFPDTHLTYRPEDFTVEIEYAGDIERTAQTLRDLGVNWVVAAAESGVTFADQLASALDLPGNDPRLTLARRDKFAMQEAVRAASLASADCFCSPSISEVTEWAVRYGQWPIVLKPVLSAGADNVFICRTLDEVGTAHTKIMTSADRYGQSNKVVLAQQFLSGVEHYVNSVSRDGIHQIVEVWRYHKRIVDGHSVYDFEDLLALDEPSAQDIVSYARLVLNALGIVNGAGHTEVMLTDNGPVLIECGARLGGGQMPELLVRCIGGDQVNSLAHSIADPESFIAEAGAPYQLKNHLRCVNLISPSDGSTPTEDGWNPIKRLPSFAGMIANIPSGRPLPRTIDMATCPGTVYLSADDLGIVESDYRSLRELELNGLYG